MCGQFILTKSWDEIYAHLMKYINIPKNPHYNLPQRNKIYPSINLPIIINEEGNNQAITASWHFLPSWVNIKNSNYKRVINARRDTISRNIEDRQGYYYSAIKQHRCLIPMNGYYEWHKQEDDPKLKIPYKIKLPNDRLGFFAGVFSNHSELGSGFAIITAEPSEHISHIHNRMPIILDEDVYANWLSDKYYLNDIMDLLDNNKNSEIIASKIEKDYPTKKSDIDKKPTNGQLPF